MGKTFVEFFSDEALENVMCMLQYKPENVVYIGHPHTMLTRKMKSLTEFAQITSPETNIEFIEVPRDSLEDCIQSINDIADKYPDAWYELTGGGEMIFIAFGIVSAQRNLNRLRIDPYTGTEIKFNSDGTFDKEDSNCKMTVEENIILHGGALTDQTGSFSTWKFTDDFKKDIQKLWNISKGLKHKWNRYTAIIEDAIKANPADYEGNLSLPKNMLGEAQNLFYSLNQAGLLRDFNVTPKRLEFRFKNPQIQHIITKTGNILELHIYEVASRRPDVFNDEVIGAVIDWNGDKSMEEKKKYADDYRNYMHVSYDTLNEIDVILMRSVIPTFISCKSGRAGSSALHELQTVTNRFGGKYAKKVLVMATPADASQSGTSFFKQRAKEMKIWLIDDVYNMTDDQLLRKLIRIQGN